MTSTIRTPLLLILRVATCLAVLLAASVPASAQGDLSFEIGWSAYGNHETYGPNYIEIEMWDQWFGIWDGNNGWGSASVIAEIPAFNQDNTVSTWADYYVNFPPSLGGLQLWQQSWDSVVVPGAGPPTVNLLSSSFIPDNNIVFPYPDWNDWREVFAGDNRGFSQSGVTARVSFAGTLVNPALSTGTWASGPFSSAGITELYDGETSLDGGGNLTAAALSDWIPGSPLKRAWAVDSSYPSSACSAERLGPNHSQGTSSMTVTCTMWGQNPLIPFAPYIDWEFALDLTFGGNKVQWELTGSRDGFPSYEAYLSGVSLFMESSNGNPLSLFGSGDTPISHRSGEF